MFFRSGYMPPEYCWWEKPLVVALKHSEGIKHTVLLQNPKLTNTTITRPLSLSSLSSVPLNSLNTNKQKLGTLFIHKFRIRKFKLSRCEGGWRLWQLVAGGCGWWLVGWWLVAFLDLLGASGLSLIFNKSPL